MMKVEIREQMTELVKLATKNGVSLQEMQIMLENEYKAESDALRIETENLIRNYNLQEKSVEVAKASFRIIQASGTIVTQKLEHQEKIIAFLAIYFEERQKECDSKFYRYFFNKSKKKLRLSHEELLKFFRAEIHRCIMRFLCIEKGFRLRKNAGAQVVLEIFYTEVMKTVM